MNPYILAPAAQRDLRALQAYMAQENIQVARRVLAEIRAACARLADNPHLGHTQKTSLISQYAFGWCGPITSFIALRHVLLKSCALCTAPGISRTSCSANPLLLFALSTR